MNYGVGIKYENPQLAKLCGEANGGEFTLSFNDQTYPYTEKKGSCDSSLESLEFAIQCIDKEVGKDGNYQWKKVNIVFDGFNAGVTIKAGQGGIHYPSGTQVSYTKGPPSVSYIEFCFPCTRRLGHTLREVEEKSRDTSDCVLGASDGDAIYGVPSFVPSEDQWHGYIYSGPGDYQFRLLSGSMEVGTATVHVGECDSGDANTMNSAVSWEVRGPSNDPGVCVSRNSMDNKVYVGQDAPPNGPYRAKCCDPGEKCYISIASSIESIRCCSAEEKV